MRKRIASLEKNAIISTGELTAFLAGLKRYGPHINLQRLQIRHGKREEPTYSQLLVDDFWFVLEVEEGIDELGPSLWTVFETGKQCAENATDILDARLNGVSRLDKVRTIIMGDAAKPAWVGEMVRINDAEYFNTAEHEMARLLPQILIDLPSVQHYCQSDVYGPLALIPLALKCSSPPTIFTHHPRPIMPMCYCPMVMPPIVIGCINRYYFGSPFTVIEGESLDSGSVKGLLGPILYPLEIRENVCMVEYRKEPKPVNEEQVSFTGTRLEFYDYIRVVSLADDDPFPPFWRTLGYCPRACRPSQSLSFFQKELDKALPRKWKGRIVLKNREDAPPCSACGLDLMKEWELGTERTKKGFVVGTICGHCGMS